MKEANILQEIKKSIERLPLAYYKKIPDQARFKGEKSRFAPPRPFDCFGHCKGVPFAFEVKYHGTHTAFPFNRVSANQIEELRRFAIPAAIGGPVVAGLLICTWPEREGPRNLFFFDIETWVALVDSYQNPQNYCWERRKSIQVWDIYEEGLRIPWMGKGIWDFESFFNYFKKNT